MKLVQCFPWCVVSPSVHQIFGHSLEVIQGNEKYGLGSVSEEGLEALNKYIRSMREKGARKNSTLNNFTDTYKLDVLGVPLLLALGKGWELFRPFCGPAVSSQT